MKRLFIIFILSILVAKVSYSATLTTPYVWYVDRWNSQFERFTDSTGTPTSIFGSYAEGVANPFNVAVDANNNAWFTNNGGFGVTEAINGETIVNYNLAFDGNQGMSGGDGIAIDAQGNIWVAGDYTSVVKLNSSGTYIGTYTLPYNVGKVAADSNGNIWFTTIGIGNPNKVVEINSLGTTIGSYSVGTTPMGIAINGVGDVYTANYGNGTITELNNSGGLIGTYTVGTHPLGIAIDRNNNVWVTNNGSNNITELNSAGTVIGNYNTVALAPIGISVDASQNIWVVCYETMVEFNNSGTIMGSWNTTNTTAYYYGFGDATGFALQFFVLKRGQTQIINVNE